MANRTINRREEQKPSTARSHYVSDSTGQESQDERRCKQKAMRQLATDITNRMKSWERKTPPLLMNQIFLHLFTAEQPWFTSGRGWGLVMAEYGWGGRKGAERKVAGGALLSVRLCLSSALWILHRSFHGKCTGTDYRCLERVSKRNREGGGGRGASRGWRIWFCSQKMSSRVCSFQIPDYAHPSNCYTLSSHLFTLFIYSGIQQVSLAFTLHCCILQDLFSAPLLRRT